MTRFLEFDYRDNFNKFVLVSIVGHISIFLIFTLNASLFPSEDIQIRNSIRVDVVDMPDKQTQEKAKVTTKKPPKVVVKKEVKKIPPQKNKVVIKKTKDKNTKTEQQKALERLAAMNAIDKFSKEKTQPEKKYAGNIINSGDSLHGLDRIQFERYFGDLKSHVNKNWDLPQWLADGDYRAQVLIKVDETGFVIKKEIIKSSGQSMFDDSILAALAKASPFPAPPERLKKNLKNHGMIMGFPNNQ